MVINPLQTYMFQQSNIPINKKKENMKKKQKTLTQEEGVASITIVILGGDLDPFQGFKILQLLQRRRRRRALADRHKVQILLHNNFGWSWTL
jgi:hypothetical protein